MSINSELTRLDAVRDALVSSVNGKGGSLAADATLWQVKAGVDAIEQGGGECNHPVVIQPSPTVSVNSNTGVVTAKYTPVAGLVEDTAEKTGTMQLTKATQPAPTATIDKSTGKVTAEYTPVAGLVSDTGKKSAELQLTAQAAQTITPGTSDKTIASGRYLTGTQTIKGDANLTAGNIKKGVSIFNISGEYEGEGGSGGGGTSDLVAVTAYTSAYQSITSLQLSGMGMDEMSGTDFSAANGTYNVTSATASLPPNSKVFKHATANYYITYMPESADGSYYSYGWCLASSASVSDPWGAYLVGPKQLVAGTSNWSDEMGMTSQNVTISNLVQTEVPAAVIGKKVTGYNPETLQYTFDSEDVAITGYDYEPQEHGVYLCNGTALVGEPVGNEGGSHLYCYIPWRGDTPYGKSYDPREGNNYYHYVWKDQ